MIHTNNFLPPTLQHPQPLLTQPTLPTLLNPVTLLQLDPLLRLPILAIKVRIQLPMYAVDEDLGFARRLAVRIPHDARVWDFVDERFWSSEGGGGDPCYAL